MKHVKESTCGQKEPLGSDDSIRRVAATHFVVDNRGVLVVMQQSVPRIQ